MAKSERNSSESWIESFDFIISALNTPTTHNAPKILSPIPAVINFFAYCQRNTRKKFSIEAKTKCTHAWRSHVHPLPRARTHSPCELYSNPSASQRQIRRTDFKEKWQKFLRRGSASLRWKLAAHFLNALFAELLSRTSDAIHSNRNLRWSSFSLIE